jgi:hypothetical protein
METEEVEDVVQVTPDIQSELMVSQGYGVGVEGTEVDTVHISVGNGQFFWNDILIFRAMIYFFNESIYCSKACLPSAPNSAELMMISDTEVEDTNWENSRMTCVMLHDIISWAILKNFMDPSIIDYAEKCCIQRLIYPKQEWALSFKDLELNEEGKLTVVCKTVILLDVSEEMLDLGLVPSHTEKGISFDSSASVTEQVQLDGKLQKLRSQPEVSSTMVTRSRSRGAKGNSALTATASGSGRGSVSDAAIVRGRGRGRGTARGRGITSPSTDRGASSSYTSAKQGRKISKAETPTEESTVRRSVRNHNEGYKATSHRKVSSVPKATPPEVLQIEEMQRLGVEECMIDPEELTAARLAKKRAD